jgi:hypothetical protein
VVLFPKNENIFDVVAKQSKIFSTKSRFPFTVHRKYEGEKNANAPELSGWPVFEWLLRALPCLGLVG